jgi:hypothetical protein
MKSANAVLLADAPEVIGEGASAEAKLLEVEKTLAEFEARIIEATGKLRELQIIEVTARSGAAA